MNSLRPRGTPHAKQSGPSLTGAGAVISAGILLLCLFSLAGCAKIADPEPPRLLIPKPAADLAARQFGSRVLLTVSLPVENTNGSREIILGEVEVFRVARDPGESATLPEEAFLAHADRIFAVEVEDLGDFVENGVLTFPDAAAADPAAGFSRGYLYAVRFINRKNQTAGLSNQTFIVPIAIPPPPDGLSATPSRDGVRLNWKRPERNADGSAPPRVAGYNVFRSDNPKTFPAVPINAAPLADPEYEDRAVGVDQNYYYTVSVVASRASPYAESLPSASVAVSTADVFAPEEPKNVDFVVDAGVVTLFWEPPDDSDVAGYRVYRRQEGSADRILLQPLVKTLSFRDESTSPGNKYEYGIGAVDTHGNEGKAVVIIVEVQ